MNMFSTRTAIFLPLRRAWPIIDSPFPEAGQGLRTGFLLVVSWTSGRSTRLQSSPAVASNRQRDESRGRLRALLDLLNDRFHELLGDLGMPGRDEVSIDHDLLDLFFFLVVHDLTASVLDIADDVVGASDLAALDERWVRAEEPKGMADRADLQPLGFQCRAQEVDGRGLVGLPLRHMLLVAQSVHRIGADEEDGFVIARFDIVDLRGHLDGVLDDPVFEVGTEGQGGIAPQVRDVLDLVALVREVLIEHRELGRIVVVLDQDADLTLGHGWWHGGSGASESGSQFIGQTSRTWETEGPAPSGFKLAGRRRRGREDLIEPCKASRRLVETGVDAQQQQQLLDLLPGRPLLESHIDMGSEWATGADMVLVDDVDCDDDQGLGLLVDQGKSPRLASDADAEFAKLGVDRPEPLLELRIVQDRVLWRHRALLSPLRGISEHFCQARGRGCRP